MKNEQTTAVNLTAKQAEYLLNAITGMSTKAASRVCINPAESIEIYDQLRAIINNEAQSWPVDKVA